MESERNSSRAIYMIKAAHETRTNARHWLRYLRKQIKDDQIMLTKEDIQLILEKGQLTMYQTISLVRAMEPGTPTNQFVAKLNQKARTPMLDQIKRKYSRAE